MFLIENKHIKEQRTVINFTAKQSQIIVDNTTESDCLLAFKFHEKYFSLDEYLCVQISDSCVCLIK